MSEAETISYHAQKKIKRYREQDATKIADFIEQMAKVSKEKIAYIDETGIDAYLYREHGYAKRGKKIIGLISGRKYQRTGIVAAKMEKRILSPLQYHGTMDSTLFEFWFENLLMPELPLASVLVMDNAAFHRKKRLMSIAQKNGHSLIFLPPYSPELNPIENFSAWLKGMLRNLLAQFYSLDDCLCYCFNRI